MQEQPENEMTKNTFMILCQQYQIDPAVALENAEIRKALAERDDKAVAFLLRNSF